MCLSTVYYGKKKQKILDSLPNRIIGYKEIHKYCNEYRTLYRNFPIKLNKTMKFETNRVLIDFFVGKRTYQGGCHIYLEKPLPFLSAIVVKAVFNKKDIQSIGSQVGERCVTVSKAKFNKRR